MKKRYPLASAAIALALVTSATPAYAQWGDPGQGSYCSASVGCYTDSSGKQHHVTIGPHLTAKEEALRKQCYFRLAGSGFAGAGGIMTGNVLAILGAAFNGGAALDGPCRDLWRSTARFRS